MMIWILSVTVLIEAIMIAVLIYFLNEVLSAVRFLFERELFRSRKDQSLQRFWQRSRFGSVKPN